MKKLLLSLSLVLGLSASAQNVIFSDNFDSYTNFDKTEIGAWSVIDGDLRPTYGFGGGTTFLNSGTPMSFIVFNSTAVTTSAGTGLTPTAASNWTARSGQKSMACFAAVPNAAFPNNDDWLISPQITLGSADNQVSFWAKSCDAEFSDEQFEVFISTTGTAVGDFSSISPVEVTAFGNYVQYTYDIFDASVPVYVGIHCTSPDMFGFMLDDFQVTTSDLSVNENFSKKFSTYPNPVSSVVTISNNDNILVSNVTITDINGRTVKNIQVNNLSQVELNVSDLNSGVYFINVDTDNGKAVRKFVKN
jgi:hypothetical protein